MQLDCIVIGGGPAGMSAALVLGRSRRKTILFDDNKPRNAVTSESHGFLTRDGIDPQEMKRIAREELGKYPSVRVKEQRVMGVTKENGVFRVTSADGESYLTPRVILATGFRETLPDIDRIRKFYGKSLFSCPFCDGWELRDRKLVVIAGQPAGVHMAKLASNWTDDLTVCTNGNPLLSAEDKSLLESRGISVCEGKISALIGENGMLEKIEFEDGTVLPCEGGFITTEWEQAADFGAALGCRLNERGGIQTDSLKRTTVEGVWACGDTLMTGASQLILAAGEGSMAAISVNAAMVEEKFAG